MDHHSSSTIDLFITCSQGLEPLLIEELVELGFNQTHEGFRGVYVDQCPFEAIYQINYCSRLAGRVLMPISRFRCFDKRSLYRGCSAIDWLKFIPKGKTFAIDANVNHPELRNSLYAAQVFKDAICDQFREKTGGRPNVEIQNPDVQLNLFIHREVAIISFDTSGVPLYKRGYRQESVEAPIQESLAAAILRYADYNGEGTLLDPCCGSGTLLIEAALIATHTPPGYLRTRWPFMLLQQFSQQEWLKVKAKADEFRIPLPKGKIYGCDINKNAVRVSKINLKAAGFGQTIEVMQADFRDFEPPVQPNLVVTNPPHGKRLSEVDQLVPLYRKLGDFLKHHTVKPGKGFVFTGSLELSKELGLSPNRRIVMSNSGIECRLLEYDLY